MDKKATALKEKQISPINFEIESFYKEDDIITSSNKKPEECIYRGDAIKEAVDNGYIKEISVGQWIYLKEAAKLVKSFQDLLREYIVKKLAYQEWIFPRLQRRENIQNFGWETKENLRGELMRVIPNILERGTHLPEYYLDPLQCPSFYRYLSLIGPLNVHSTPYKVYEVMGGWTYRNERPERIKNGFQTGLEFIGAEMVYCGTPEEVTNTRLETLKGMLKLLDDLDIVWRLVVGGSCCHSDSSKYGNILEKPCKFEKIPTLDIECYIPYTNEWIELGGGDIAFDRLTSQFGIKFEDPTKEIWSGCQGMGFGRTLYIFLSQYGLDQQKWPNILNNQCQK